MRHNKDEGFTANVIHLVGNSRESVEVERKLSWEIPFLSESHYTKGKVMMDDVEGRLFLQSNSNTNRQNRILSIKIVARTPAFIAGRVNDRNLSPQSI